MLKMEKDEWFDLLSFARRELNHDRETYRVLKLAMRGKSMQERGHLLTPIRLARKNLRFQVNRLNRLFGDKYGQ